MRRAGHGGQLLRLAVLVRDSCGFEASAASTSGRVPALAALTALQSRAFASESKSHLFTLSPRSLYAPQPHAAPAPVAQGLIGRALIALSGFNSRESRLMRAAQALYTNVQTQATDPRLLEALSVGPDFQSMHAMLCLHVWLLLVRLRAEGGAGKELAQVLYDEFQEDVEQRARRAGVKVKLSKQLAQLEQQFYGSGLAYDAALRGEADLASALQRNVYAGSEAAGHAAVVAARYVRRELACLAMTPSEAVMAGDLAFSSDWGGGKLHSGAGDATEQQQQAAGVGQSRGAAA